MVYQNAQLKRKLQDLNGRCKFLEEHNKKWETTVTENQHLLKTYLYKNL